MAECKAVANNGRIQLLIDSTEQGYPEFMSVLKDISKKGCLSWFGDVSDDNGKERCGIIIAADDDSIEGSSDNVISGKLIDSDGKDIPVAQHCNG